MIEWSQRSWWLADQQTEVGELGPCAGIAAHRIWFVFLMGESRLYNFNSFY
jgi:hypothetical protein